MSQQWDIKREGRAWGSREALQRYSLAPDRIEMVHGRLLAEDEERLTLLALLLENVGVDRAVRLGDPAVWLEAVQGLDLEEDIAAGTTAEDANLPSGAAALSPEARACAGLLGRFMSDLSEDHWAAAWLIDLEFVLWSAVRGESTWVRAGDVARLRYLSSKCRGWITWNDLAPHRQYVPRSEWEAHYTAWRSRREQPSEGSKD